MAVLKQVLLALIWVLFGAGIALAGGFYFLSSDMGQGIARDYFVKRGAGAPVDVNAAAQNDPQVAAGLGPSPLGTSTVILVPKTNATEQYYIAINTTVRAIEDLNDNNVALAPVLNSLNQKTLSCTFVGFYDDMKKAQDLLATNKALTTTFAQSLTDFSAANVNTPDPTTKTLTQTAITAGKALQVELENYNTALEKTLNGDVPTSAQEKELYDQVMKTHSASSAFSTAVQAILARFQQTIKAAQ